MRNSNKLLMGILCLSMVLTVGCQKIGLGGDNGGNGGSGSSSGGDPLVGQTYYTAYTSTNSDIHLLEAQLIDSQNAKVVLTKYPSGNLLHAYTSINRGTYTKKGNIYTFTWTYETCDPVGSQDIMITYTDPGDSVDYQATSSDSSIHLLNSIRHPIPIDKTQTIVTTEDTACTHF